MKKYITIPYQEYVKYTKHVSKQPSSPATKVGEQPEESSTVSHTADRVQPVPLTAAPRRLVWKPAKDAPSDGSRPPVVLPPGVPAVAPPPLPPGVGGNSRHQPKRDGDTVSDSKHTPSEQAKDNDKKQPDVKHGRTEEKPPRARHNTRPERKTRRPQDYREVWRLKWKSK